MQLHESLASLLRTMPGLIDAHHPNGTRRYIVYIVTVKAGTSAAKVDFYVGSTSHSASARIAQHREGGPKAARMFRRGKNVPHELRSDLIPQHISFGDRASAENAEGLVADHLARQHKLRVHSDQMSATTTRKVKS